MPSFDDFDDLFDDDEGDKADTATRLKFEREELDEATAFLDPDYGIHDDEAEEVDQIAHDQASYPRTPSAQLRQEW